MACAAKDEHGPCGLSFRNPVHTDKRQFGYHEFVAPEPPPLSPKEECLEELRGLLEADRFDAREAVRIIERILSEHWH